MKSKFVVLPILLGLLVGCGTAPTPSGDPGGNPPEEGNSVFHSGEGVPSASIGKQYDHYLDLTSKYVYEKNDGVWYNKFSIGSDVLLSSSVQSLLRKASPDTNEEIKTAIANTFYSTNISFDYYLANGEAELNKSIEFHIVKEQSYLKSYIGGNEMDIYYRVNNNQDQYYIVGMTDGFINVDNPNLYCSLPFPSLECTPNLYYGFQDSEVGGFAAIIVSKLGYASYDEETKTYSISNITASHNGISYKGWNVEAGSSEFSVSFKLSEDKKYVSILECNVIHSSVGEYLTNDHFKMEFHDFHSTTVSLPE